MILDCVYNKKERNLSISYVKENGFKSLINFNVNRFKSYYRTPSGQFKNWDGSNCGIKWTDSPHSFDIKTFIEELDPKYKKLLMGKKPPKLYTWDIEVDSQEFPEPAEAKYPVTTISIVNEKCDIIVLGTKHLTEFDIQYIQTEFDNYLKNSKFFMSLGLKMPTFKYVEFKTEREMLIYFLTNIVAKVPVLAGWNSLLFDWHYIQNRVFRYYPDISFKCCSYNGTLTYKNAADAKGNKVKLTMPNHTLVIDMMDVIGEFDMVVMPIKESLSLDYIASESIGMHKIEYKGDLHELYETNYSKYVFYNGIDSVLVQLIDKKFKTMANIYTQSLYCKEQIGNCFSKIRLSEALVFQDFYDLGVKIVPERKDEIERGTLVGAYVAQPIPGKHKWVCCNDFASLYPSTIITCNLSFENFVGPASQFTEDELNEYRKNKNYFVSVNGNVYKNDKPYALKRIQAKLKANRNTGKYLAKQLDALVMLDIEHIEKHSTPSKENYSNNIINAIKEIGYDVKNSDDLIKMSSEELSKFKSALSDEIIYYTSFEQAMKLLGNSIYGGSSHVAFYWFNLDMANDITGEARNLIHKMESHIPKFLNEEWGKLTDVHNKMNIKINQSRLNDILKNGGNLAEIIYGDTDSCLSITNLKILDDDNKRVITIEDFYNENIGKDAGSTLAGHESVSTNSKVLNWSEEKGLYYGKIKRIIRHKVNKSKWKLKTKSGKEIIVTNDHSMIVFRNGKKLKIKPKDILKTDKILVVDI